MCGFVGLVGAPIPIPRENIRPLIERMAACLEARGPDDHGSFVEDDGTCALGFQRLSVMDLSAAGHQPMHSASGRYVITFNGEIYDHAALRAELIARGNRFVGTSDTEVVLAAFETFGRDTIDRLFGMFAIALWDRHDRTLHLYRDRFGKKPLYFGRVGALWAFGSELSPMHLVPGFESTVDRSALTGLLRYLCVPAPLSIFEGIEQLEPGHHVVLRGDASAPIRRTFFSPRAFIETNERMIVSDVREAEDLVDATLRIAVRRRLVADVPVGALLSGGIDSSLVTALMQAESGSPVETFTIGYAEHAYDESSHAEAIAKHLGTKHHTLRLDPSDALRVIPKLGSLYSEPFADASQIPTLLVSELARKHVTVALTGDGGDELFGGYNRYFLAPRLFKRVQAMPFGSRELMMGLLERIPAPMIDSGLRLVKPLLPRKLALTLSGDRVQKAATALQSARSLDELYRVLLSHHHEPLRYVFGGREPSTYASHPPAWLDALSPVERMMMLDTLVYLPNDILVKVDRATMAHGLEARAPFLDMDVAHVAWRLAPNLKVREEGKWILKRVLERYMPRALFDRPKTGFGIPLEHWLRTDLRQMAGDLLSPAKLAREGYFDAREVSKLFAAHLAGRNHQSRLWPIIVFQLWLDAQTSRTAAIRAATTRS